MSPVAMSVGSSWLDELRRWPPEKFRILSLDGGGVWSLLEFHALKETFGGHARGHDVLNSFDLVVCTSGGGLVVGALLSDCTLEQAIRLEFTKKARANLFKESKIRTVAAGIPRWSADEKGKGFVDQYDSVAAALREDAELFRESEGPDSESAKRAEEAAKRAEELRFMEMRRIPVWMRQSPQSPLRRHRTHFLITAFDYVRKTTAYFRSYGDESAPYGTPELVDVTLPEAMHASSNAPVKYFDGPAVISRKDKSGKDDNGKVNTYEFWDGGIAGLSNPAEAAVVEALSAGIRPEDIQLLSLGTGTVRLPDRNDLAFQYKNADVSPENKELATQQTVSATRSHSWSNLVSKPLHWALPRLMGLLADVDVLAESIMDSPPGATLMNALVMIHPQGLGMLAPTDCQDPELLEAVRFVRMSPFVAEVAYGKDNLPVVGSNRVAPENVVTIKTHAPDPKHAPDNPADVEMNCSGFEFVAGLDMDTDGTGIEYLEKLAHAWVNGGTGQGQFLLRNQHVVKGLIGESWFVLARDHWHLLHPEAKKMFDAAPKINIAGKRGTKRPGEWTEGNGEDGRKKTGNLEL
ncbi:acyl transferase/acyl hydrolase/lysophospholipase [Hyaloraphidium curvatum]|nr:acyl transferase/acyl hydrolase/lysophospholipase [Hyaloraphidium curvatum]